MERPLDEAGALAAIHHPYDWCRLLLGLAVVFGAFQATATALGSERGEAGVLIGAMVVALLILVERLIFGQPWRSITRGLGLGRPQSRGLLLAAIVALALLLVGVAGARTQSMTLHLDAGWLSRVPGLWSQAGLAEEALFRGYLFGHLRRGRPFWHAATASMAPFVLVHLLLFLSMPWPIALAAVALAVVLSFPLAHLYELGGGTIWAPAIVHFVIQGAVKVVAVSHDPALFALIRMAASAVVPMIVFAARRAHTRDDIVRLRAQ